MGLDEKVKSLIAVGAAIASNCEGWVEHHVGWARAHGVDEQDVVMAIEIGKATRKGAAARIDQYLLKAFNISWNMGSCKGGDGQACYLMGFQKMNEWGGD